MTGRRGFVPLPVTAVRPAAADGSAVTVEFTVDAAHRPTFAFAPGQHLTVRLRPDAAPEVRRSYSVCSTPDLLADHGLLRIGVRAVPDGAFSQYAAHRLAPGDTLDVMPPLGAFTTRLDPARRRRYAALVAGSGITPVLSLVSTALATEPRSTFTVLYGNRHAHAAMFAEDLADLKDRHGPRLQTLHLFSREAAQVGLAPGRITPDRLTALLDGVLAPHRIDEWFLCGPAGMVTGARGALLAHGVPGRAVHTELFHPDDAPRPAPIPDTGPDAGPGHRLTVRLDGVSSTVPVGPGGTVLDAALRARPELPYSCRTGVCATCRARVVDGAARMDPTLTLEPDELAAGYVLTCQAVPTSERLTVDYDA